MEEYLPQSNMKPFFFRSRRDQAANQSGHERRAIRGAYEPELGQCAETWHGRSVRLCSAEQPAPACWRPLRGIHRRARGAHVDLCGRAGREDHVSARIHPKNNSKMIC